MPVSDMSAWPGCNACLQCLDATQLYALQAQTKHAATVDAVANLLEQRPIWLYPHMLEQLAHESAITQAAIDAALSVLAYRMTSGPWKPALVARGVDPARDASLWRYQVLASSLPDQWQGAALAPELAALAARACSHWRDVGADAAAQPAAAVSTSYSALATLECVPPAKVSYYQVCDVADVRVTGPLQSLEAYPRAAGPAAGAPHALRAEGAAEAIHAGESAPLLHQMADTGEVRAHQPVQSEGQRPGDRDSADDAALELLSECCEESGWVPAEAWQQAQATLNALLLQQLPTAGFASSKRASAALLGASKRYQALRRVTKITWCIIIRPRSERLLCAPERTVPLCHLAPVLRMLVQDQLPRLSFLMVALFTHARRLCADSTAPRLPASVLATLPPRQPSTEPTPGELNDSGAAREAPSAADTSTGGPSGKSKQRRAAMRPGRLPALPADAASAEAPALSGAAAQTSTPTDEHAPSDPRRRSKHAQAGAGRPAVAQSNEDWTALFSRMSTLVSQVRARVRAGDLSRVTPLQPMRMHIESAGTCTAASTSTCSRRRSLSRCQLSCKTCRLSLQDEVPVPGAAAGGGSGPPPALAKEPP